MLFDKEQNEFHFLLIGSLLYSKEFAPLQEHNIDTMPTLLTEVSNLVAEGGLNYRFCLLRQLQRIQ